MKRWATEMFHVDDPSRRHCVTKAPDRPSSWADAFTSRGSTAHRPWGLILPDGWAMGLVSEAMKILFFGRLGEQFGSELEIDPLGEAWTVGELREMLCSRSAAFADALRQSGIKACVDQVIVPEDTLVRRGQEVAFIPPLSGG